MTAVKTGGVRRVLLVGDDPRFSAIVAAMLSRAGMVCHCAVDVATARALAEHEVFHVAVVELGPSAKDGVALVRWLTGGLRVLPVLVLAEARARTTVVEAVRAGANGYLFKEDVARLLPSIDEVLAGGGALSAAATRAVLDAVRTPLACDAEGALPFERELTRRELDVLRTLARGLSYEQCALVLDVSLNTVRTHVRSIYDKLGAASCTEAVVTALRLGLIAMP